MFTQQIEESCRCAQKGDKCLYDMDSLPTTKKSPYVPLFTVGSFMLDLVFKHKLFFVVYPDCTG